MLLPFYNIMFPYDKHVSPISYMIHMLAPFNNILFPYEAQFSAIL